MENDRFGPPGFGILSNARPGFQPVIRGRLAVGLAVLMLVAFAAGCAKKNNPAQPAGGGSTNEPFASGNFSSTSTVRVYVHAFPTAGTFAYHCSVHGTAMSAAVEVGDLLPDSSFVTIGDNFFSPSLIQVKTGGYVKWNATGGTHGVIRP